MFYIAEDSSNRHVYLKAFEEHIKPTNVIVMTECPNYKIEIGETQ